MERKEISLRQFGVGRSPLMEKRSIQNTRNKVFIVFIRQGSADCAAHFDFLCQRQTVFPSVNIIILHLILSCIYYNCLVLYTSSTSSNRMLLSYLRILISFKILRRRLESLNQRWTLIPLLAPSKKRKCQTFLSSTVLLRLDGNICTSSQVKYRLLHGRLERLGRPQLTQPQLRPIT